jgi:hypothetical protein
MERIDLYVPPEEYAEVEALGGLWDEELKRWFIRAGADSSLFGRWLLEEEEHEEEFGIVSDRAYVASARVPCAECAAEIEVICVYCESGNVAMESDEPLMRFTVSYVWAIDDALALQLARWPSFRMVDRPDHRGGYFANHCPQCGTMLDDELLHSEPDQVFFDIPDAAAGSVVLTPLVGQVRLSGDYRFQV